MMMVVSRVDSSRIVVEVNENWVSRIVVLMMMRFDVYVGMIICMIMFNIVLMLVVICISRLFW